MIDRCVLGSPTWLSRSEQFGDFGEQRQAGHDSKVRFGLQLGILGWSCPARYARLDAMVMR